MEEKRVRNPNWSEEEKKVLRMLVLERADIIENKEATNSTNAAKKLAWEDVLSRFNTVSTNKRSTTQLLNQWRNMKNNAKKTEFAYRRARMMTGGGPPPPSPPAADRELIEAIPNEFTVDSNIFDADSIYANQIKLNTSVTPIPTALPETSQIKIPPILEHPPSSRANKKKKRKMNNSDCCNESHEHQIFVLAKTARQEAMAREKEAHECKMRHERELHEGRMAVIRLEADYWKVKINKLNND